jgi:hypothetical protein
MGHLLTVAITSGLFLLPGNCVTKVTNDMRKVTKEKSHATLAIHRILNDFEIDDELRRKNSKSEA